MQSSYSKQEWALKLADMGFSILPLQTNSRVPLKGISWTDIMTSKHEVIIGWFNDNQSMNYGVCPGEKYVVIDLDVKDGKNGVEVLAGLEAEQDFDDYITIGTFGVKTPSGGYHHYLSVENSVGNAHTFPQGVDIRGVHGYVVGPGCSIDNKPYEVISEEKIKKAPDWVIDRLRRERKKDANTEPLFDLDLPAAIDSAREFLLNRAPAIEGQNGNDHTFVTACQMKDFGVSEDQCIEMLLAPSGWNERCDPPWDNNELSDLIRNAYHYGKERPGIRGGVLLNRFLDSREEKPGEELEGLEAICFEGFSMTKRKKRRRMIIANWLPAHGFTAILAKRGAGKTVTMLDIGLTLACDLDWHGVPTEKGWSVVYLCGEDDEGLEQMLQAWHKEKEIEPEENRLFIMAGIVDLMSANSVQEWTEFLYDKLDGRPAIIIVDTWQRASTHGGQNKDEDMQLCVSHVEAMAKSFGGPAIVAFHPPKHDGYVVMGSSIIENSTTAIWTLEEESLGRRLSVTRIKGSGIGQYQLFDFKKINLEEKDVFGQELTGIIAEKIGSSIDADVKEMQKRLHEKRNGYARLIRYLLTKNGKTSCSMSKVSININELFRIKDGSSSESKEAAEQIELMKDVGVSAFSKSTNDNSLKELFGQDTRAVHFGDGYCLAITNRNFSLQKSEIGKNDS